MLALVMATGDVTLPRLALDLDSRLRAFGRGFSVWFWVMADEHGSAVEEVNGVFALPRLALVSGCVWA